MAIDTQRPVRELKLHEFKEIIAHKEIAVSTHALDHLSQSQRKVFIEQDLINMLLRETPRKIYLQANSRYRVYYRKKDGYRELILQLESNKVVIVSFMDPIELPKVEFDNE